MVNKRPKLAIMARRTVTTAPNPSQLRESTLSRREKIITHRMDMRIKTTGRSGRSGMKQQV